MNHNHRSTLPGGGYRPLRNSLRRTASAAVTGLAVIAVAACTGSNGTDPMAGHSMSPAATPGSSSSPTPAASSADVMFAAMMIPHHQQAVELSDLILVKDGLDPEIKQLADQIKAAQQPEIDTMNRWLEEWGTPPDHSEMDHGGDNGGMMTPEDMRALRSADTDTAQRMFLEGMIKHHEGAVAMAQAEVADGQNPDAIALADTIIASQQAEITTMERILDRL